MDKNQFAIVGRIDEIFAVQQVSDKFRKREFILEIEGQYPEHVKFQLVQDKSTLIDQFKVGDLIKVEFNLRGRAFVKDNVKSCFTNLEAWRIKAEVAEPVPQLSSNSQL